MFYSEEKDEVFWKIGWRYFLLWDVESDLNKTSCFQINDWKNRYKIILMVHLLLFCCGN